MSRPLCLGHFSKSACAEEVNAIQYRDALDHFHGGNIEFARRALENAENVLTDIDERLAQLEVDQRAPFGPLVKELRKSILAAESECA